MAVALAQELEKVSPEVRANLEEALFASGRDWPVATDQEPETEAETANRAMFEDLTKTVHGDITISAGTNTVYTPGRTTDRGQILFDAQGRLVHQTTDHFFTHPDLGTTTIGTSLRSPIGNGFVQDTTSTIALDLDTQVTLAGLSHSLVDLQNRTGNLGTYYITAAGDSVTITLRSTGAGGIIDSQAVFWPHPSLKQELSRAVKQNLLIKVKSRNHNLVAKWSPQEQKARDTLRDMVTEKDWRRYVTNGFVMVRGGSGYWYQIFSGDSYERIQVYKDNKRTHKICIHSDKSCPPTDHVINMMVMVEIDEQWLWQNGNVWDANNYLNMFGSSRVAERQKRESILDAYKRIKGHLVTFPPPRTTSTNSLTLGGMATFSATTGHQIALACQE